MSSIIEIYEVVKQYEFLVNVPSINNLVKAKIIKRIDRESNEYDWVISHNYALSEQAETYYPSNCSGRTVEETYASLLCYVASFKDIKVTPNPLFR